MTQVQSKYTLIAKRYADALAELGKDKKLSYEKISSDLNTVKDILSQSPDLWQFLVNPIISVEDKKSVIEKVFAPEIDVVTVNFLKVLVDKSRFEAFYEIVSAYGKLLDKINNISRVQVVSAVDLSMDAKKRLQNKLEEKLKKTVTLDYETDPEIIAGLVIKMGDNVIDTSLRHKLEDLSKAITK